MTTGANSTSKLALGTVQFGMPYGVANQTGQVTREEAKRMLQLAYSSGIDTIDTAIGYGDSESCLGDIGVDGFKVVTKLPKVPDDCLDVRNWIGRQVSASVARLGVNQVYGLLLHSPAQLVGADGNLICRALLDLKNDGLIGKIGVSVYSPGELDMISKLIPLDLVQAPFNLVDRRLHTSGWMERLKAHDVEIHVRSVFLQGLLLMSQSAIPPKFSVWDNLWRQWHLWLADHSVSAIEACVSFASSFQAIDRIVVGADSVSQLEQIVEASNGVARYMFPDVQCDSENLINPACWATL